MFDKNITSTKIVIKIKIKYNIFTILPTVTGKYYDGRFTSKTKGLMPLLSVCPVVQLWLQITTTCVGLETHIINQFVTLSQPMISGKYYSIIYLCGSGVQETNMSLFKNIAVHMSLKRGI